MKEIELSPTGVSQAITTLNNQIASKANVNGFSLSANDSKTFTVPSYAMGLVATSRATDGFSTLAFVAAGTLSVIKAGTNVSYSLSGESLTVSNLSTNVSIRVVVVNFNLDALIT